MTSAITSPTAVAGRRPRLGMALIAALALGVLVATGTYAQRVGAFSAGSAGLGSSAAARSQFASLLTAAHRGGEGHATRLLAWSTPRIPHVRPHAAVALPPRVVTVMAPAPQAAAAAPAVQTAAPPAAAVPVHEDSGEGSGGGSDD